MATVMEGIETQQHPFVSVLDRGHFTSGNLEGAGTKVVKRTAEAMDAMVKGYEEKVAELERPGHKKMKRTAGTEGYMREIKTHVADCITSTRSPQGLAVVKAKLIVDPEGSTLGEKPKWIVPPHSLIFAKRDKEQFVIEAVADVQNFYNASLGEAKYAPIGVSLEDGLDATKFHMEHESRRYFSVAVEGVVSLQCPKSDAERFKFGDPVYVNTAEADETGCFKLKFYDTGHYLFKESGTFRIGYFVEQIDKQRGGMRIKLAIQSQADPATLDARSSSILTDAEAKYNEAVNNVLLTLVQNESNRVPTIVQSDEIVAKSEIKTVIEDVKNLPLGSTTVERSVLAYFENLGVPYNNLVNKEEEAAINRAIGRYTDARIRAGMGTAAAPAAAPAAGGAAGAAPAAAPAAGGAAGAATTAAGGAPTTPFPPLTKEQKYNFGLLKSILSQKNFYIFDFLSKSKNNTDRFNVNNGAEKNEYVNKLKESKQIVDVFLQGKDDLRNTKNNLNDKLSELVNMVNSFTSVNGNTTAKMTKDQVEWEITLDNFKKSVEDLQMLVQKIIDKTDDEIDLSSTTLNVNIDYEDNFAHVFDDTINAVVSAST